MKLKRLLPVVSLVVVWALVSTPAALAIPINNLDVTHGASGEWVTGGYDFNGTGYAWDSGFKPFHGVGAFTAVYWWIPDSLTGVQFFHAQYAGSYYRQRLYWATNLIVSQIADGSSLLGSNTGAVSVGSGKLQMITQTWDKDDDSGKLSIYINTTEYKSSTGLTNVINANDEIAIGSNQGFTENNLGTFLTVYYLDHKLTSAEVTTLYNEGPDHYDPPVWHYWDLDTGSGNIFYDYAGSWIEAQNTTIDLLSTNWYSAQRVDVAVYLEKFQGNILFLVSLAGGILIPVSTGLMVKMKRDEAAADHFMLYLLLFLLGWGMFLGGALG